VSMLSKMGQHPAGHVRESAFSYSPTRLVGICDHDYDHDYEYEHNYDYDDDYDFDYDDDFDDDFDSAYVGPRELGARFRFP